MLDIGERLASYEPLWENWYKDSYLGGGNSGRVYRLKQSFFGETRYSAVKVIPVDLSNELGDAADPVMLVESRKSAVVNEIKNMYKLKGKEHIVQCLAHSIKDIYNDQGMIVGFDVLIQMDYYISVPEYMQKYGPLSENEVLRLALHISNGIKAMHEIDMLHRDIKPENIYVDSKGNFLLGDLGIAKQEELISYSTFAGTRPFIAPEVWKASSTQEGYTKTADIYSFGIMLYYLLNGNRIPFAGEDSSAVDEDKAVFDRINGKEFPPPKGCSELMSTIVMQCCAYEPINRFRTISAVIRSLEELRDRSEPEPVPVERYASMYGISEVSAPPPEPARVNRRPEPATVNYSKEAVREAEKKLQAENARKAELQPVRIEQASSAKTIAIVVISAALILMAMAVVFLLVLRKSENSRERAERIASVTVTTTKASPVSSETDESSKPETTSTTTTTTSKSTTSTTTTTTTTTTTASSVSPSDEVIPDDAAYIKTVYVNSPYVRLRKGPSYSYDAVIEELLPEGASLEMFAERYDEASGAWWAYVDYSVYSGWCIESMLTDEKPAENTISEPAYLADEELPVKILANYLEIRTGPGDSFEVIGYADIGDTAYLKGYRADPYTDRWIYIEYDGVEGWVQTYSNGRDTVEIEKEQGYDDDDDGFFSWFW